MMRSTLIAGLAALMLAACTTGATTGGGDAAGPDRVHVAQGTLEGLGRQSSGVREFRGVPFAAPPVGALRWKEPQPAASWTGVREAKQFSARCMQASVFADMVFRSNGNAEDCLYLNVWTPAHSANEHLPVLVYYYGGGFIAGAGDELRYDGESMAEHGVVVVTVNYRMGAFGFMAHPELTAESPHHASGNYGLLDQVAALQWVHDNVAAFGGDPARVTVAGESAGSFSSSAMMASPLSRNLVAGAIGESGAIYELNASLADGERNGVAFAQTLHASNIAAMRALSADQILAGSMAQGAPPTTWPVVDGYLFPKAPGAIFEAGEQAHVPLLVGSNSAESDANGVLQGAAPTVANYRAALRRDYGANADTVFAGYPAASDGDAVLDAAQTLSSDRWIAFGTWQWIDASTRSGGKPSYYYYFTHPRPAFAPGQHNPYGDGPPPRGATHSSEIEYAMGNLHTNVLYAWNADDDHVSQTMEAYFANFIKTGNPNGAGLPDWPTFASGQRMVIDVQSHAVANRWTPGYRALLAVHQPPVE
ncbi:MAG: carboxylesterase family protein [Pseudomonadota bacterium]